MARVLVVAAGIGAAVQLLSRHRTTSPRVLLQKRSSVALFDVSS